MAQPTTQQVVEKIADDYRKAAKAIGHASHGDAVGFMNPAVMEEDATAILDAYNEGKIQNVSADELSKLMDQYGASDIYHLTATYFNSTGKILNVE